MSKAITPVLPPDAVYPNIRFYARPKGGHIHSNRNCPMLNGGQFEHYEYCSVSLEGAEQRTLKVCPCVNDTLHSHHRLTIYSVRSLVKASGWKIQVGNSNGQE